MPVLTGSDITIVKELVRDAGSLAHEHQKMNLDVRRKADTTIVTEADYLVQEMLLKNLKSRFPRANYVYEEDFDRSISLFTEDSLSIVIDPIDGSAMFSMHLPIWCVSVGVFEGFRPVYGFVYSPASDLFFHCDGTHSYLNDVPLAVDHDLRVESETNIFYASEIHKSYRVCFPGKVRNLGSTALQASLVADNRRNRTIAFVGRSFLWDWAGAIPVILCAGGSVRYISGAEVDYRDIVLNRYFLPDFLVAYSSRKFEETIPFFVKL